MDSIDQLVGDIRQESCVFCRLEAAEPWRIEKSASPVAPFYAVLSGGLRVAASGAAEELAAGDFLVLPRGDAHQIMGLASSGAPAVSLLSLFAQNGIEPWKPGMRYRAVRIAYGGSGPRSDLLVGLFDFGDPRRHPLLGALPSMLVARAGQAPEASWLGTALDGIAAELDGKQTGANVVIAKQADLLFTHALRAYLAKEGESAPGWVRGIADPVVGAALSAIHSTPGRPWTLASLAAQAGCSRAVFAKRFGAVMGQGAFGYLTTWRMHTAARLLRDGEAGIAEIAGAVGYRADAFAGAFKRWSGQAPSEYRAAIKSGGSKPFRARGE